LCRIPVSKKVPFWVLASGNAENRRFEMPNMGFGCGFEVQDVFMLNQKVLFEVLLCSGCVPLSKRGGV
jgi:hypothetical protein